MPTISHMKEEILKFNMPEGIYVWSIIYIRIHEGAVSDNPPSYVCALIFLLSEPFLWGTFATLARILTQRHRFELRWPRPAMQVTRGSLKLSPPSSSPIEETAQVLRSAAI